MSRTPAWIPKPRPEVARFLRRKKSEQSFTELRQEVAKRKSELRKLQNEHDQELLESHKELVRCMKESHRIAKRCELVLRRQKTEGALRILQARSHGDPFWRHVQIPIERDAQTAPTCQPLKCRPCTAEEPLNLDGLPVPPEGPWDPQWKQFSREWVDEVEAEICLENKDFKRQKEKMEKQRDVAVQKAVKCQTDAENQLWRLDLMVRSEMRQICPTYQDVVQDTEDCKIYSFAYSPTRESQGLYQESELCF